MLIFAAASNWGHQNGVAFPAQASDYVFCIFSYGSDVRGKSVFTNPDAQLNTVNFAMLGEDVAIHPDKDAVKGSSVATALATGLAARILDFARHTDSRDAGCDAERLHKMPGMKAVLQRIATQAQGETFLCIQPALLWKHGPQDVEPTRGHIQELISR